MEIEKRKKKQLPTDQHWLFATQNFVSTFLQLPSLSVDNNLFYIPTNSSSIGGRHPWRTEVLLDRGAHGSCL